ncbi:hypothetical protein QNI19_35530 [Cytophagaceae bacterium DM2B3-1]|uniref:Uncharacterized protein n=1 Tax=Xanthocytophaga flava TaxID=3048013 RepID=A0ABT7CX00_9BACT|nr:hypothetical protein [Xanthocytophaga flavus]MDJ1498301.1 hypothetical protein [Xanthocytophaga flavus]
MKRLFFAFILLFIGYVKISYAQSSTDLSVEKHLQKYVLDSLTINFVEQNFGKNNQIDLQVYFIKVKTNIVGKPTAIVLPYSLSLMAQTALRKKFDQFLTLAEKQSYSQFLEASMDYTFAIHIYKPAIKRAPGKNLDPYIGDLRYFYEDGTRFVGPVMFTLVIDMEAKTSGIDDGRMIEHYR